LLSILFAVVAAAANAVSSVLQRKGAMKTPPERQSGLRVVVAQLHHRAFFGGFGLLIVGFLAQAAALSVGSLAVVQPILAAELPITHPGYSVARCTVANGRPSPAWPGGSLPPWPPHRRPRAGTTPPTCRSRPGAEARVPSS
jgi:hypothetical protein